MRRRVTWFIAAALAVAPAVRSEESLSDDPVDNAAAKTIQDVYGNVDADRLRSLPIGVFDSGTGGLTVLEAILSIDGFRNDSQAPTANGDGLRDFCNESFIFLADQANMPYGNYPVVGKEELLDDLIVKDAWFLMGRRSHRYVGPENRLVDQVKSPVKAIVIACNTATAYGKSDIEEVLRAAGVGIHVVGVIDAGAKGAVEVLQNEARAGTIGVVPTKGTALSGAYPTAIREKAKRDGLRRRVHVVQQGAFGLAGAIDGAQEFIRPDVQNHAVREDYQGPSMTNPDAPIDLAILPRYGFEFSSNRMLYTGSPEHPTELQLNSVDNYIAYHLVTLLEKIREASDVPPLRAIVLACTHFPFFEDAFHRQLNRLREYQEDGQFVYRRFMAEQIELIDPAYYTARELYESLAAEERLRHDVQADAMTRGRFYITVPRRDQPGLPLNESGWFTYDHKYGRNSGDIESDYRVVPLDDAGLDRSVFTRLERQVPEVWKLITASRRDE